MSNVDDLTAQVGSLQQQLENMKIVNEYLQDQSRAKNDELLKLKAELKDRDENMKVCEHRTATGTILSTRCRLVNDELCVL